MCAEQGIALCRERDNFSHFKYHNGTCQYYEEGKGMRQLIGFLLGALLSFSAAAAQICTVYSPLLRATAPGQDSASLEFNILCRREGKLTEVSSPVAGAAEFHSMTQENGMMKMQRIESIQMTAGKLYNVSGGQHVMLLNLKQPLKEGDKVPFTVTVELLHGGPIPVTSAAIVKSVTDKGSTGGKHNFSGM
jgi:copper(I)-binding protein